MSVYGYDGTELNNLYGYDGSALASAYGYDGTQIFTSGGGGGDYDTYDEAIEYAYTRMMTQNNANTVPFALFADNHSNIRPSFTDFFGTLGDVADWTKLWFIDLGDATNLISYTETQNEASTSLQNVADKLDAADIPQARRMQLLGNHDLWAKDANNVTYALTNHAWLLSKYCKNTGATHYYDNDFVLIDSTHGIKFVCIGAWDFDSTLGGHSHYAINGTHMGKIIEMLSVVDAYDIVLLTHISPYKNYSARWKFNDENDGVGAIGTPTAISTTGSGLADVSIDALLAARNAHTSGTINDSYGVSHAYDFTGCNGKIICGLSGHEHRDEYGYSASGGILANCFDCYYQSPKCFYLGLIDTSAEKLKLWKIDQAPMVYEYELPFSN